MNHKTYYRDKISIDNVICTKFKLIFLVTIALLFSATVSFAVDNPAQKSLAINCKTEKSTRLTITGDPEVTAYFTDCCCKRLSEGPLRQHLKDAVVKIMNGEYSFDDLFGVLPDRSVSPCNDHDSLSLDVSKDSNDWTYECYTKDQIKAYYNEMVEFYKKGKSSEK